MTGVLAGSTLRAADFSPPAAVVHEHSTSGGDAWYALAVQDPQPAKASIHRHILLVDTSASQVGHVREVSLQLVEALIGQLPAGDQVQLLAMDTDCESLTDGFVAASSQEITQAIRRLQSRTPLGATNLLAGLNYVLAESAQAPTSVLWIGDGMSVLRTLDAETIANVTQRLRDASTFIHSVVIGPKTDTQLPAMLANLTGGVLHRFSPDNTESVARSLQSPGARILTVHADGKSLMPESAAAFLRNDRHAILIGKGDLRNVRQITVELENRRRVELNDVDVRQAGAELQTFYGAALATHGVNTPIASLDMLREASRDFENYVRKTTVIASRLQRMGKSRQAPPDRSSDSSHGQPRSAVAGRSDVTSGRR